MRTLFCLCLATGLLAGEPPQPGRNLAFLSRILADPEGGSRPWKTFRTPAESGSAVVEVVGELTREELRQVAFQEFLVWFRMDLQRFWLNRGSAASAASWASATLPVDRFGGNPVPRNVPLGF
ncbi:MAG: hypothetical protein Q8K67_07945 [Geothrix sp.]|nr:hypothetical protein [Geothrix sp.]